MSKNWLNSKRALHVVRHPYVSRGLNLIKDAINDYEMMLEEYNLMKKEYEINKKKLKALDAIKETLKIEEADFFYDEELNKYFFIGSEVSKEKFDLLKEVLL